MQISRRPRRCRWTNISSCLRGVCGKSLCWARHKLARERIEAMQAIWTQDEAEYHGDLVHIAKMKQWPKPVQKPYPPIIVGGGYPHAARRAIRYRDGSIPRADRLDREGVGASIELFRTMATQAGRDPATLPITLFRVPDDLERLRFVEEIGVDQVVFSLPAEGESSLLPIIEHWSEINRTFNG